VHGLYEPTWWIDEEVLTLNKRALGTGWLSSYRDPVVHSESTLAPKWYFARIAASVIASQSRSGLVRM
jgi:hypothetical protein